MNNNKNKLIKNSNITTKNIEKNNEDLNVNTKFNCKWSLYYHQPENEDYSNESYTLLANIITVKDFWITYHTFAEVKENFAYGMFFFMREHIFPKYEDYPVNQGSFYSFPVQFENAFEIWELLSALLVSENITGNHIVLNQIAGISISPKRLNMIIKIWCLSKFDLPSQFPFNENYFHIETYFAPFQREKSKYLS